MAGNDRFCKSRARAKSLMPAMKIQLPALVAIFQWNKVDLDQIAARGTVVFCVVSFREIPHEPAP
jgi:hypothetical protein